MSSLHVRSGNGGSVQVAGSDRLIQGLCQAIACQNCAKQGAQKLKMMSFLIIGRAKRVSSFPTAPHLTIFNYPASQRRVGVISLPKWPDMMPRSHSACSVAKALQMGCTQKKAARPGPTRPEPATLYRNPLVRAHKTCARRSLFRSRQSAH